MIVQASTNHPSQAPTVEEIEKEDTHARQIIPPKKTLHVLESSEDDTNSIQPRKKIQNSTKKDTLKPRMTITTRKKFRVLPFTHEKIIEPARRKKTTTL